MASQNIIQITDSEVKVIQQFISSGDVVFDVGANVGNWSFQVLSNHNSVEIHMFEAIPQNYYTLIKNYADILREGNIFPNNIALSNCEKIQDCYFYSQDPALSTMYRRLGVEQLLNLAPPTKFSLPTITLDTYCQQRNIHHINFLKIDVEGAELDVLMGAIQFLKKGSIDIIQFEYGGTYQDAGITLQQIYELLEENHYFVFKIEDEDIEFIPVFSSEYEDYQYSNFLAISDRICSLLMGEDGIMLNINELCSKYNVEPHGVIHIGAHEGQEVADYIAMNVSKMILIEANPEVYERLQNNLANYEIQDIYSINCAVSNYEGVAQLHITSSDQSSSLLPLKIHSQIYPQITEEKLIEVPCKTLDVLLHELSIDLRQYNLLNIDIQGAELLALEGAKQTLNFIDAINIEVNYDELYEGCSLVHELDKLLDTYGFERIITTSPYHRSWGDAFYIKKPIVVMSTIGNNGRFANQLFQYAFLRIYAKNHNLRIATSPWIGQTIFGHAETNEVFKPYQLSVVRDLDNSYEDLAKSLLPNATPLHVNVDFIGYFQYHTKYYSPHKELFRSLFKPVPIIASAMNLALERLQSFGKTIVGLHLRRGDYGHGIFFTAPTQWYRDWLEGFWDTLEDPVLFIASDDINSVISDFSDYMPITSKDLDIDITDKQLEDFYPDFYLLSHCNVVAISNSSFSFAACMLNEVGNIFVRPHLPSKKLISFDPWNSNVLLNDSVDIDSLTL
ncbi:FkbM family methyltransferase [Pseudanabaena yagii]|uniref:FkbM family methyltransferase n=1 Tax=Pseudanabaena yagii GIHE-NHR1 TaxID=2722753 RepID=A0ABX1LU15_9CYAN|nr:FkbM family methyltransferase [Pseudanabaena yagii]NMF58274.1 FkbM family methyltransferase [Pseudanabaena yagii GIHE-NHR1]